MARKETGHLIVTVNINFIYFIGLLLNEITTKPTKKKQP